MPPTTMSIPDPGKDFFDRLLEWEKQVHNTYRATKGRADPLYDSVTRHSINLGQLLRNMPKYNREQLMAQYRQIIGFDEMVAEAQRTGALSWLEDARPGKKRPGRIRVNPTQLKGGSANPLAILYNRMTVNLGTDGDFAASTNVPKTQYMRNQLSDLASGKPLAAGKKVMVFDTETGGLEIESGIRQISAATMETDSSGILKFINRKAYDEHFRTHRMQMGYLADKGLNAGQMQDRIARMFNIRYANDVPGSGTKFAEALEPFMKGLLGTDYIVGHNVGFDIDQVLVGLSRTSAYLNDTNGFKQLVDQVREHVFSDLEIAPNVKVSRIKDTLSMAANQLPGLERARELEFMGDVSTHSLANLMLSTNLGEKIRKEVGEGEFKKLMGMTGAITGQHQADFDTQITGFLLKYMGQLEPGHLGGDATMNAARSMVVKGYGITPISKIRDPAHISREMFRELHAEGGIKLDLDESERARLTGGMSSDRLHDYLMGNSGITAKFDVTPLEQEIFHTRAAQGLQTAEDVPTRELTANLGNWRRFSGQDATDQGILNKVGTLFKRGVRPSQAEYESMQRKMASAGIPFADLALPERMLSSGLSRATSNLAEMGNWERQYAAIADDLGISRFMAQESMYISKSGRNISLPLEVLEAAQADNVFGKGMAPIREQMFSLSAFETQAGQQRVNLMFDLGEDAEKHGASLASWLGKMDSESIVGGKRLAEWGYTPTMLADISRNLPGVARHGIGVGQLEGEAGSRAFGIINSIYQGIVSDESRLPFKAGILNTEGGIIRTGAFVLDRFRDAGRKAAYGRDMKILGSTVEGLEQYTKTNPREIANIAQVMESNNLISEWGLKAYEVAKKRAPLIAGAAAVALGGFALYRHKKQQELYGATFERQPIEGAGAYSQYRQELGLGPAPATKRVQDPLATAGVVGNLDRNSIGHTNMRNDKNANLYSGAL